MNQQSLKMNKSEYIVYYSTETEPLSFSTSDMSVALKFAEDLRRQRKEGLKISHITLSAEDSNQVGQNGVASVENSKTPDGVDYSWVKRRDGI